MNYIDAGHVRAYQGLLVAEVRSSRHGWAWARFRLALASSLVLMGAKLMPDTPAFIGDRVLVFERPPDTDRELQPAA